MDADACERARDRPGAGCSRRRVLGRPSGAARCLSHEDPTLTSPELVGSDPEVCTVASLYGQVGLEAMYEHTGQAKTCHADDPQPDWDAPPPGWVLRLFGAEAGRLRLQLMTVAGRCDWLVGGTPSEVSDRSHSSRRSITSIPMVREHCWFMADTTRWRPSLPHAGCRSDCNSPPSRSAPCICRTLITPSTCSARCGHQRRGQPSTSSNDFLLWSPPRRERARRRPSTRRCEPYHDCHESRLPGGESWSAGHGCRMDLGRLLPALPLSEGRLDARHAR